MTFLEILRQGTEILSEAGIADASYDAWYLLEYTAKIDRVHYLMNQNGEIDEDEALEYMRCIEIRKTHIPLQHITHSQMFMGLELYVNENVLIPRQDTEVLVLEALKVIEKGNKVLDMCTGSGCIIISLAHNVNIDGTGVDISPAALEVARRNARGNECDIEFIQSNLFEKVDAKYDVIVSNPPYIRTEVIETLMDEVKLHDPMNALDGYEDGLYFYREIVSESAKYLKKNGYILFEIGHDQAKDVSDMLSNAGFDNIEVVRDLAGLDRVVKARLMQ